MKTKFLFFLLFLTIISCSKNVLTTDSPKGKTTLSLKKGVLYMLFFSSTKSQNKKHSEIYQRFHKVFGDNENFLIKILAMMKLWNFKTTIYIFKMNRTDPA